ncbi:MAG: hypothetical protein JSS60_08975 [Verrucomicrobia bacterium]|nr:hypothetical protein [Verrucomicrobiota bacterium]
MAVPGGANAATPKAKALKIIEQIEKIGFPSVGNIETLHNLIGELSSHTLHLTPSDQMAIKHLMKTMHRIEDRIKEDGEISVKMYTTFNKHLILLKTSLRNSH